jgi:hypothetical protein
MKSNVDYNKSTSYISQFRTVALAILLSTCTFGQTPRTKPPTVDFQREIRPILSDACFHCHGPDRNTRMVGLRLDTQEGALEKRKSGVPIVPGSPEQSLVYQRITNPQKARRMPPEYSHKSLSEKQIESLRRWIAEGAPWKEHWAFVAPKRPPLPKVVNSAWAKNPIDRFVLAKLEAAGLRPGAAADRRTLIRRAALDITGLPPRPEDVDAFVKDVRPNAYERLLDRLMATPQWGEHRGRYWLDAARYGDTHGIHIDNYREIWPYRDWVIKAFNNNMPFDQFTIEQLAGDLLPNPTMEQQIATGFQRCNVTTNEGGVIPEEVAAMYAKDRVDTTGAVFLGLTVGCATCHDHKFDPISTKDFYSLAAFYRNTTQDPLDGNISDTPPVIVVPAAQDRPRWQEIADEETKLKARLQKIREASVPEFAKWLDGESRPKISTPIEPADEAFSITIAGQVAATSKNVPINLELKDGVTLGDSNLVGRQALHFAEKSALELPNVEAIAAARPFTISTWVFLPKSDSNFVIASQTDPESSNRGWALELNARTPILRLTTRANKSVFVRAAERDRLTPGTWNHIAFTYDGSRNASGISLFVNGKPAPAQGSRDREPMRGDFRTYAPLRLGSDGKRRFFDGGAIADFRIYTRALADEEAQLVSLWPAIETARLKPTAELSDDERNGLHSYYLLREHSEYQNVRYEYEGLQDERKQIARRGAVTHVQNERTDQQPFAHILYRGMYDQPREKVEPAVPSALPPLPASYPKNRLGLAKWLVDADNPVMARVTVNRFWQELFGTGIVKTAEDFGSQGEPPSHPELLDWLAVEFRESGWDVKKFFKLMMMSSTYRQSAAVTPEKLRKDPGNRLLSRGPRFRMDAEMVRDYALASSGLLVPTIGGPSVKPYQPDGIWEAVAMNESNTRIYKRDSGDKLYRRSLYTFWKRSAPPASMDIFNAPTRETCTVRRERTNTPLQALVTMNDVQFVEAARTLAQHASQSEGTSFDARVDFIAVRLLARRLDIRERAVVRKAYTDYLAYYDANPADAKKLISVGEAKTDTALSPVELAALTMVVNQLMNLDEVLNK